MRARTTMGVKINIITLLHKEQKEKGIYLFSIDVVVRKRVADVVEERQKENFHPHPCMLKWNFELPENNPKTPLKIQLNFEGGLALNPGHDDVSLFSVLCLNQLLKQKYRKYVILV